MFKSKVIISYTLFVFSMLQFPANGQGFPAPSVNVVSAEMKALAPVSWVSGTVVSRNNSKLAVEVSGRLVFIAELGAKVKKGDVIAQIDTLALEINKNENIASVSSAKAKLNFLESEVERKTSLSKRNLSAKTDLDETISLRDIAKADLAIAEARLSQIKQSLSFSFLKAPFDGLVAEKLSHRGEFINSGTTIIRLVDTASPEAIAFAPLTAYQFLRQAETLAVSSAFGNGLAPVKALIPIANERSHLMQLRLDMTAFDWPIGLNIKVAVANGDQQQVMAVPRDALIIRREGIHLVRVNSENISQQISVEVGIGAGEYVQVIGDIKVGDKIVVRGAENLQPGQAVQIKPSNQNLISGQE